MTGLFLIILVIFLFPVSYIYFLVFFARKRSIPSARPDFLPRLAVIIPAHNEETVIGETLRSIRAQAYPQANVDIYVAADHCSDRTAEIVRSSGLATCWEREDAPAGSKGAVLNWMLERLWTERKVYPAVVFFDADSCPEPTFFERLVAQLQAGRPFVQGRPVVANPKDGWYPRLNWAIEAVDGRLNQLPRSNLGLSAKIYGYGFGVHMDVLKANPFPTGLTEDYEYRLHLLAQGIKVHYEPEAVVYSEAAANWEIARRQHARWRSGIYQSRARYRMQLARLALDEPTPAVVDAWLQTVFPSYSTLTLLAMLALLFQIALILFSGLVYPLWLILLWIGATGLLLLYPLIGLFLEGAPAWAYLAALSGPVFVVLRSVQALKSRLGGKSITWVRTEKRGKSQL